MVGKNVAPRFRMGGPRGKGVAQGWPGARRKRVQQGLSVSLDDHTAPVSRH